MKRLLCCLTIIFGLALQSATAAKPNILFIMVDDLGKDWISCYGADEIDTPNIDRLAKGGLKFHNAWSMPQCTPTRATLLTGQYPWRTGWVNHWDVPRWGVGYFDWANYTTFAGLTPLLLEKSLQAKFLVPMGISLGFGVIFATVITLILVPAMYLILEDIRTLLFGPEDKL